jgi:hypothetical protein
MGTAGTEPLWETVWWFLKEKKKTKHTLTIQPTNYTSGHLSQRNGKLSTQKPVHDSSPAATLFVIAKNDKQSK